MDRSEVIVVTGVGNHVGARVARVLAERMPHARVLGLDGRAPHRPLPGVETMRVDLRARSLTDLIEPLPVTTVVHAALLTRSGRGGRAARKDVNVLGTMRLLAAAECCTQLRRVVIASSTAVHGAGPSAPAVAVSGTVPVRPLPDGLGADSLEAERQLRALARHRPDVVTCAVRLADVVGPDVHSPLADLLQLPIVPVPLGRDPRLQVLHQDDAVAALLNATTMPEPPSVVEVAGEGVVTLTRAARLLGRPRLPGRAGTVRWWFHRHGDAEAARLDSGDAALLAWGRVVDTAPMRTSVLPEPAYTTRSALASLASPPAVAEGVRP